MRGHWSSYIEAFFNIRKADIDIKISEKQIIPLSIILLQRTYKHLPPKYKDYALTNVYLAKNKHITNLRLEIFLK